MSKKAIVTGFIFSITILLGFLLTNLGRPYNNTIFSMHKLISLAGSIYAGLAIRSFLKTIDTKGILTLLVVITISSVFALFLTGSLMSIGVGSLETLRLIHLITTVTASIGLIGLFGIFLRFKSI